MPEFRRDKYDFTKSQESFIRCVVMKMFESFNGKFEVFKLTDILNQFFCRGFWNWRNSSSIENELCKTERDFR